MLISKHDVNHDICDMNRKMFQPRLRELSIFIVLF